MSEFPPLIYVDLIEEEPLTREAFIPAPAIADFADQVDVAYRAYRAAFQPWRIMILSGDNQARLFRSTERYFNRADARHAAELVFGSGSNVYLREKDHGNQVLRMAQK